MKALGMAVLAIGGSVLMLWLAFTNEALAWAALAGLAVLAFGGIWLALRNRQRNPWAGLAKPGDGRGH
jgi:hypothetical protein